MTAWFALASTQVMLVLVYAAQPQPKDYPEHTRHGRCELGEFDCTPSEPSASCVPFEVVRDCIPDCSNGADEECGLNQTLCDTAVKRTNSNCGKCVEGGEEDRFCVDRKWKNLCYEEHVLQCKTNSNCVHESWINDNEDDCMDGSDEIKCPTPNCEKSKPTAGHHTHSTGNHEPEHEAKPTEFPCDCSEIMRSHPEANSSFPQRAFDPRCYSAGKCPFSLLCDFELFGGGWTTVMHRQWPTQLHFNKTWADYKIGFGTLRPGREFWIGNDRLHSLTAGRQCVNEMVIRMRSAREGHQILARYESFAMADESDGYKLSLGPLLVDNPLFSNVDELLYSRDRPFVTWDRQQHFCPRNHGGWWMGAETCGAKTLTSDLEAFRGHSGITWGGRRVAEVSIFIRPRFFTPPIHRPFAASKPTATHGKRLPFSAFLFRSK